MAVEATPKTVRLNVTTPTLLFAVNTDRVAFYARAFAGDVALVKAADDEADDGIWISKGPDGTFIDNVAATDAWYAIAVGKPSTVTTCEWTTV